MKRILIFLAAVMMPALMSAQAQINTKKTKIADFTQKVTKVVMTGNMFYDGTLKDEIASRWRVSPYEFCTLEEFDALKTDDQYYFLMITEGQFRKESEPGLQFLSLVKGGKDAAEGIDKMLEIVSMPIASAEDPSGREIVFLPAFLDIIQNYSMDSMDKDINAYTGLSNYTINIANTKDMEIIFSEDDLSQEITQAVMDKNFDPGIMAVSEEDADEYMIENAPKTLISYVAVPTDPVNGSYCYKMLIDTQSHKLYYYRKHKITAKWRPGFLFEDIKRICAPRTSLKY